MANFEVSYKPRECSLLYLQETGNHRSFALFTGEIDSNVNLKARRADMRLWSHVERNGIHAEVRKYIISAGFDGVFQTSFHKIDHKLISALVERWCPKTHTFHLPVGEVIVTLEDVQVMWGLPIDGPVVSGTWESNSEDFWSTRCYHILGFYPDEQVVKSSRISVGYLVDCLDEPLVHTEEGYIQRARIYILALLGGHLFSDSNSCDVSLNYLDNIDD